MASKVLKKNDRPMWELIIPIGIGLLILTFMIGWGFGSDLKVTGPIPVAVIDNQLCSKIDQAMWYGFGHDDYNYICKVQVFRRTPEEKQEYLRVQVGELYDDVDALKKGAVMKPTPKATPTQTDRDGGN